MTLAITASIVLYNNDPSVLLETVTSFLKTKLDVRLYLVDNSKNRNLEGIATDPRCIYIYNGANLGFGKAHNIAMRKTIIDSKYHLILNPDVYFEEGEIEKMFAYMEEHHDVGQLMPHVLYPQGEIQYSGKLLPTPMDLIGRRLLAWLPNSNKRNEQYELRQSSYAQIMNVPNHLGCFMLIRSTALAKAGLFDESLFMYMEDVDLTRRIFSHYKTVYYPHARIFHRYEKGSRKRLKLLFYHIRSAVTYFNKWG